MTLTPDDPHVSRRRLLQLGAAGTGAALVAGLPGAARAAPSPARVPARQQKPLGHETIGGGSIDKPARGPAPAYGPDDMTLVQNWNFGTNGTIPDIDTMSSVFQYHDQFGTFNNGNGNYGADTVAPNAATALPGQPVQDPDYPVRAFTANSLQTYLVPLNGAKWVKPWLHNAGCGSFVSQYTLPAGGALLGQNLLWETRVRYNTPPYFWFAIWTSGNQWDNGAEMDVIESFGYNNGPGNTNYKGHWWHSDSDGGTNTVDYSVWQTGMASVGITCYDAAEYHTWQWRYHTDDTYQVLVDGITVQYGTIHWTLSGIEGGTPINMSFLFDAGWGSTVVGSVDHAMLASRFSDHLYEWDYSRIYLKA